MHFVRAAGFVAAIIGAALTPTFADPSIAFAGDTAAPTATYVDHAAAQIDQSVPDANDFRTFPATSQDPEPVQPVSEHAVASVSETPALAGDQEEKKIPKALSALVDAFASEGTADREMECLAGAIYFESKGEPLEGQLAVAEVVINRAGSGRYPADICSVITQPWQFSFIRKGRFPVIGDGSQQRSMVFTGNLVDALLAAEVAPGAPGQAYWVADAEPYELREIIATVRRALEAEGFAVAGRGPRIPARAAAVAAAADAALQGAGRYVQPLHVLGELRDTIACDIGKARRELGWEPATELFGGMRASIRWCVERGVAL